jgi:hypothetical protein
MSQIPMMTSMVGLSARGQQENSPGPEGARAENGTWRRNYARFTMHSSCLKNISHAIMRLYIRTRVEDKVDAPKVSKPPQVGASPPNFLAFELFEFS